MPISVTCSCGNSLRVKDEWVGKRAKCPKCGNTFLVTAGGGSVGAPVGAAAPAAAATGANIYATSKKRAATEKPGLAARFSLSPMVIFIIAAVILIPTVIAIVKMGPVAAQKKWAAMQDDAESDVRTVIGWSMQAWLSENSGYNPADPRHTPTVKSVTFDSNIITHVPEIIPIQGLTSEGFYNGKYNTKTGEVECDMKLIDTPVHIVGRHKDGKTTAEINGKPAKMIMKKREDE